MNFRKFAEEEYFSGSRFVLLCIIAIILYLFILNIWNAIDNQDLKIKLEQNKNQLIQCEQAHVPACPNQNPTAWSKP